MKVYSKSAIMGFALGVLVALVIIFIFFNQTKSKEYAYVNIDKVINYVVKEVSGDINKDDAKRQIEVHKKSFEQVLDEHAKQNNVIIFSSPKPIAGAKDITDLLLERTFNKKSKGVRDDNK